MCLVIAVSGPIAVGKSEFIGQLTKRLGAIRISTRELIQSLRVVPSERGPLQEAGEELDRETNGKWVAQCIVDHTAGLDAGAIVVIDSVRIAKQVEQLRRAFESRVRHIHLTASHTTLANRFNERKKQGDPAVAEFATYDEAKANPTEAAIEKLGEVADVRISTDDLDPAMVANRAIEQLGLSLG